MIRPLPESKKREFRIWLTISTLLCTFTLAPIVLLSSKALYHFIIYKNKCKCLEQQIQNHASQSSIIEKLQQKLKQFTTQKNKFERYTIHEKPHTLLMKIAQIMPNDVALTRFAYEKNNLELTGHATDQTAILNLVKKLDQLPHIKKSDLISLQQLVESDQFNFSIKATII